MVSHRETETQRIRQIRVCMQHVIYIYIYIYIHRETDRQTDRQTEREGGREIEKHKADTHHTQISAL